MIIASDEIHQAARRLLGAVFDAAVEQGADVEAVCDLFFKAFLSDQLPSDACEGDIELLLEASVHLYLETEMPVQPDNPPLYGCGDRIPGFLKGL